LYKLFLMTPERWQQIDQLFHFALERAPQERALFITEACAGDEALKREVESLLKSHERAESFIEQPASDIAAELLVGGRVKLVIGQQIGHYTIMALLGVGGMGEVYLAQDMKLGRKVALKLLPSQFMSDPARVGRFEGEARAASSLNHPNILTVYEIGESDGAFYIATEFVEGQTLRQHMETARMAFTEVLNVGVQLASALSAAHLAGVIHRDIKPENIMIRPDGYVKILDFGLAKLIENSAGFQAVGPRAEMSTLVKTEPGMVMGTAHYMSPEQSRGEPLDARSDIFSLGAVLYQAATGRPPFDGPSLFSVMHEVAVVSPPPPSALDRELPREFDFIVERALAKDKERRYSSVSDLAEALKRLKSSSEPTADAQTQDEPGAFVGREPELKRLEELLEQTAAYAGRMVFITGEPGIGKTTLADEFLRRSRKKYSGLLHARGRCVEQYGPGEAYLPFLDAMGSLLAGPGHERVASMLRTYAPTWCLQLPASFASTGDLERFKRETIGATKERLLREMGDALEALTAEKPLVILLEDLHWADPSSADLIRSLCQRTSGRQLLIVGTFRPGDLEIGNHPLKAHKLEMEVHDLCDEIALGALSNEHIARYLNVCFDPNDFSSELPALIQSKTEGHTLFVTSLVQFLAERQDIVNVNGCWSLVRPLAEMDLEVPESVRSMIRKKIDALEEEDRRTLQYASVEGEEFISTVAAKLLGIDDLILEERLDRLDKVHRLIQSLGEEELPDGRLSTRYRFAHALYQNVLYGDLVSKRRTLLHRLAGEQLVEHFGDQSSRISTPLAMHFERGRDFPRAIEYLIQAGDNAIKLYANGEAEAHYSHALALVEKLPREEQPKRYLNLYEKRGRANLALTRFQPSLDDFTRMLELARASGAPASECVALNALANAFFYSHRLEEMGARAEEAVKVAEQSGDERARIEAMVLLAMKRNGTGELAEAKLLYDEAIAAARHLKHLPALVRGLVYRGVVHFFQTEYELAEVLVREALHLASELRDGFTLLQSRFFLGLILGNQGRMSEALQILGEALAMAQRNGDRIILARVPNAMGWIYRELGDLDQAIQYDRQSVEMARHHQIVEAEANSLINLGQDYAARREGERALSSFREAEMIFDRDEWLRWRFRDIRFHAGATEHWLTQGDFERADGHARRLFENATLHKVPKYIAIAHKLLAELAAARGQFAEADAELEASLEQLSTHPVPIVTWKIYAALGRLRLQLGEVQSARAALAQAASIIDSIAAGVNDERLRSLFLNSEAVREVMKDVVR
jgi:serine/threonine protein kinase/tetratricopeptide (TPR) repeat protein